jgi:hypothetical protein
MSLSEGVSSSLIYKAYATGVITAGTEATSSSDLGASGGQVIRRVASTLSLAKNTYESAEIRSDRQRADFRHGVRRVQGNISAEFSPGSFFDFLEAAHRDTKVSSVTLTESDLTSATGSHSGSTWTFASGDPVALGLHVGDIIRFTNLSVTADDAQNYLIKSFSGTSNRVLSVTPAPTDQTADVAFSVVRPGKATIVPLTGHVSRKYGIEHYASDLDTSRLFTECRVSGYRLSMPATGMCTAEFNFMGRDMELYTGASAPFFTAPTAATTTGLMTAVNGTLLVGGVAMGVVTGLDLTFDLAPTQAEVIGQNFNAEIFLGRASVSGTMTAYFTDTTLISNFLNEDEVAILVEMTTTTAAASPAVTILLPRVKFGDANLPLQGEGGQTITMPFTALLADGTVTGVAQSTIRIVDTEAT